jgi:biopolymer transport protein ExbB
MDLSARFLSLALGGAGWVLWLLVALSVISLAISLERLWYFRTYRVQKATMLADMQILLRERVRATPSVGSEGLMPPSPDVGAAAEGAKALEKLRLERNLTFLATVGSNAPFIGLFGTVLGIIKAFHDLAGSQAAGTQAGGPAVVMAGISEALVATAVGLMVAIPAVVAFNYFNRRVRGFMCHVEWTAQLAVADLKGLWSEELRYPAEQAG